MDLLKCAGFVCGALLCACVPTLDAGLSRVESPRILAVRSEPAQASPGETVRLEALVAAPVGAGGVAVRWWRCDARRTLAESGAVSSRCTGDVDASTSSALAPLGEGDTVSASVSPEVCALFGPNPPPAQPGEPAGRPVDPDPTGGYFAPFRASISSGVDTHVEVRLRCPIAGAPPAQAIAFNLADRGNGNPVIASLRGSVAERSLDDRAPIVAPGERVSWTLAWPSCAEGAVCGDGVCDPEDDARACPSDCAPTRRCEGAERYPYFDPRTRAVTIRRESMRASFYGTSGAFRDQRLGVGADDRSASLVAEWVAPELEGEARLWFVLRDDRGGVAWRAVTVTVRR